MQNKWIGIALNVVSTTVVGLIASGILPEGTDQAVAAGVAFVTQVINLVNRVRAK